MKTLVVKKKSDIRTVDVKAEFGDADLTWKPYGYTGTKIMATDINGNITGPSGMKVEWKEQKNKQLGLACSLPENYPFVPMEPIDDFVTNELEKRLRDFSADTKKSNFKIENILRKKAHNGNSQYWIVQTNIPGKVDKSSTKDDDMKFGFSIRNGYNTGVALGIDVFTFRLICKNGAIMRGMDFGTTTIRHMGNDPKKLLKTFQTAIMTATEGWSSVLALYNKLAITKLNEKMAQYLYKSIHMPVKYFPKYYEIATPKEIKEDPKKQLVTLTNEGKSVTLWDNFNDITNPLWKAKDEKEIKLKDGTTGMKAGLSFFTIAYGGTNLHRAMSNIVSNKAEFA
jgi:hypothetical protein